MNVSTVLSHSPDLAARDQDYDDEAICLARAANICSNYEINLHIQHTKVCVIF